MPRISQGKHFVFLASVAPFISGEGSIGGIWSATNSQFGGCQYLGQLGLTFAATAALARICARIWD
jgi:hypothetical protein